MKEDYTQEKVESVHTSVLLNETIDGLNLKDQSVVLDGTFGGGGHTYEVCKRFPKIKIIAIDQDQTAWHKAKHKFQDIDCDIEFLNMNFRDMDKIKNISHIDGIILDLGLSSDQLENAGRGFSFQKDEPLLMTMKADLKEEDLTAKEIVNTWAEESIADIIYGFGEEQFSRRIAKGIVEYRKNKEIASTFDLVKIINESVPNFYKKGKIHPATKTFQALRIAVNDELGALRLGLQHGLEILKKGGRMSVISFHSLEDRIVKNFFRDQAKLGKLKIINKKPIVASKEELFRNKRARSAKLRIVEKI